MAWLPNPIACDVCGAVKQPSNHWYYAEIRPDTPAEVNAGFSIWPWDYPAEDRSMEYVHLCGQACAIRKLAEFLSGCAPVASTNPPQATAALADPSTAAETGSQSKGVD